MEGLVNNLLEYVALEGLRGCPFAQAWDHTKPTNADQYLMKWAWNQLMTHPDLDFWQLNPKSSQAQVKKVFTEDGVTPTNVRRKLTEAPTFETCQALHNQLILVASSSLRRLVLGISRCISLNNMKYCLLEEVGRTREIGLLQRSTKDLLNFSNMGECSRLSKILESINLLVRLPFTSENTLILKLSRYDHLPVHLSWLEGQKNTHTQMRKRWRHRLYREDQKRLSEQYHESKPEVVKSSDVYSNLTPLDQLYRSLHAAGPEGKFTAVLRDEVQVSSKAFEKIVKKLKDDYNVKAVRLCVYVYVYVCVFVFKESFDIYSLSLYICIICMCICMTPNSQVIDVLGRASTYRLVADTSVHHPQHQQLLLPPNIPTPGNRPPSANLPASSSANSSKKPVNKKNSKSVKKEGGTEEVVNVQTIRRKQIVLKILADHRLKSLSISLSHSHTHTHTHTRTRTLRSYIYIYMYIPFIRFIVPYTRNMQIKP